MGSVVAIDIGGTTIKSALAPRPSSLAQAVIGDVRRTPTPVGDARALTAAVVQLVRSYGPQVEAVGVVMPGILDVPRGRVRIAGNLRLVDAPIVEPLVDALGLPVSFDHDVRAGALAELHTGAARGLRDAVFLPIGTGIAAAFIIDGAVRSADGYMGEVGHVRVGTDEPCVCGHNGCLEAVASAAAISRLYRQRTGIDVEAATVIARAQTGDVEAREVWDRAVTGLLNACAIMANLLGPQAIIVGGGLARAGEQLLGPLRQGLSDALTFQRVPEIRSAQHGDDAGCLGAAIAAFREGGLG